MPLSIPSISVNASIQEIADCMESSNGVLLVHDLPQAPYDPILQLLRNSQDVTNRLNKACPEALIYKDASHAQQGTNIDRKCSLDLSLERLESISKKDPEVAQADALQIPLEFYKSCVEGAMKEKLLPALAHVVGCSEQDMQDDVTISYRMIDYYPWESQQPEQAQSTANGTASSNPRLAEHRDFGFLTMIQASHTGLQVKLQNKWCNLPRTQPGTAVLMGGWCAKIRSNGRFPAILHRVPRDFERQERISAVLFANPKRTDTNLQPCLREEGEEPKFIQTITAEDLQKQLVEAKTERSVDLWLQPKKKKKGLWSLFRKA